MAPRTEGSAPREYSIDELASRCGLSRRTLHFYADKALLHPVWRDGQMVFSEQDCIRLDIIILARRLHFSLAETWRLIHANDSTPKALPAPSHPSSGLSRAQLLARIERLTCERESLQKAIEMLRGDTSPGEDPLTTRPAD